MNACARSTSPSNASRSLGQSSSWPSATSRSSRTSSSVMRSGRRPISCSRALTITARCTVRTMESACSRVSLSSSSRVGDLRDWIRRRLGLLQLVHGCFEEGDRILVTRTARRHFQDQVLGRQQYRTQMRLAALAHLHETHRYPEEAGDAEGLIVPDAFQVSSNALGAGIDTEQRLDERAFGPLRRRLQLCRTKKLFDGPRLRGPQPDRAFALFEFPQQVEQACKIVCGKLRDRVRLTDLQRQVPQTCRLLFRFEGAFLLDVRGEDLRQVAFRTSRQGVLDPMRQGRHDPAAMEFMAQINLLEPALHGLFDCSGRGGVLSFVF